MKQGLTGKQWKQFLDLLIEANNEQVIAIHNCSMIEMQRRKTQGELK